MRHLANNKSGDFKYHRAGSIVYQFVDPDMTTAVLRFSPVARQHINFITEEVRLNSRCYKVFYFVACFEIDISSASHGYQGFPSGSWTNRSFV
jgi:hypothetical protein